MRAKVLKEFPYAADGVHSEQMMVGAEREFDDGCAPGLVTAGLIAELGSSKAVIRMAPSYAETPYTELPEVPAQPELGQVELEPASGALSVRDLGKGWFAVFRGDEKLTKSVRSKAEAEAEMTEMLKSNS